MRITFTALSTEERDTFDPTVDVLWFRDVGLYRIKAIPTPIGFLSFRQMLLIGVGAIVSLLGVKAAWGVPWLEVLSLAPLGVMFWISTRRVGMVSPETQLLVYLTGGRVEKGEANKKEKREEKVLEVSATETRPGPFSVSFEAKLVGGRPRDAVLLIDGQERARDPPVRISGSTASYRILCSMEASEVGVHNAEIRLDGTDEGIQKFRILVKSVGVEMSM